MSSMMLVLLMFRPWTCSSYLAAAHDSVDEVDGIGVVLRVLPVDVKAIDSQIGNQSDGTVAELLSARSSGKSGAEVHPEAPATDREDDLQVTVLLLELVKLVEVAKQLGSVGSDISRVGELGVSPLVGEDHFAGLVVDVGETIVDFSQVVGWEVGNEMLARVDGPVDVEDTRLVLRTTVATTVADITSVSVLVSVDGWSSLAERGQREESGGVGETHVGKRGRLLAKKFKQEDEGRAAGCASDGCNDAQRGSGPYILLILATPLLNGLSSASVGVQAAKLNIWPWRRLETANNSTSQFMPTLTKPVCAGLSRVYGPKRSRFLGCG
jgi:hypothetical protein